MRTKSAAIPRGLTRFPDSFTFLVLPFGNGTFLRVYPVFLPFARGNPGNRMVRLFPAWGEAEKFGLNSVNRPPSPFRRARRFRERIPMPFPLGLQMNDGARLAKGARDTPLENFADMNGIGAPLAAAGAGVRFSRTSLAGYRPGTGFGREGRLENGNPSAGEAGGFGNGKTRKAIE
jgi:hypothetical protein